MERGEAPWVRTSWLKSQAGRVVNVEAPVGGRVERVYVVEQQLVRSGELLVALDHREIDLQLENAATDLAQALFAAGLFDCGALAAIGELPATVRQAHSRYLQAGLHACVHRFLAEIRSPVGGRVVRCRIRQGELVASSEAIVSIETAGGA